jgi:hypothetical protein
LDENQVGTLCDEFGCRGRQTFVSALRRPGLHQHDVAAIDPAELLQLGSNQTVEVLDVGPGKQGKVTDAAHLARTLRAHGGGQRQ